MPWPIVGRFLSGRPDLGAFEKGTLVTIIRVGTSKSYNENWDLAFGGKRTAGKKAAKAETAKTAAKRSTAVRAGKGKKKSAAKAKAGQK